MSPHGLDPRVAQIGRLFEHLAWADAELARAMTRPDVPQQAVREYAHIAGAGEIWLSRIERRESTAPVWPDLDAVGAVSLARKTADGYRALIRSLDDAKLDAMVPYTNTAGRSFQTPLGDVLLHVAMHAQYHRGKVNLLLRQGGTEPVPTDFIAFVRGVPAARS